MPALMQSDSTNGIAWTAAAIRILALWDVDA
jgi:hypothetical protein